MSRTAAVLAKDAFLVFRALCKLSIRTADATTHTDLTALRGKARPPAARGRPWPQTGGLLRCPTVCGFRRASCLRGGQSILLMQASSSAERRVMSLHVADGVMQTDLTTLRLSPRCSRKSTKL